ncbi:MAG: hypothetical protein HKO59_03770, partial [Phycisphaerales bacterium]|nr:hypothetical protein [Phycisphaerales bacterium]
IATWEDLWRPAAGGWALADLTVVGPAGETYVTTRPQAGGGNGSGLLKYTADGTLEWAVVREEVTDGSEGFTDLELTPEGVSVVGITVDRDGNTQTLLLNYAADGTLQWEARSIGPAIPGFLVPQLAIGPAGERVVATDDGAGAGVLERYDAAGALLDARALVFEGFGGVSALEIDSAGNAVLAVLNNFTTYAIEKYDAEGTLLWSHEESGDGLALSEAFMAIDASDDIVATGSVEVGAGKALQVKSRVWKLSSAGALLWTYDSEMSFAISRDLAMDDDGAVSITRALAFPSSDLVRIDAAGAESWRRTFSEAGFVTSFRGVAINAFGDVIVSALDAQGLDFFGVRVLRYDSAGGLEWTGRIAEDAGHEFFVGDLQTGPDGRAALAITKRPDTGLDQALTVHLRFAACTGDLDGTEDVAFTDLLILLAAWGPQAAHPADFDGDGVVGFLDLLTLIAGWGACAG